MFMNGIILYDFIGSSKNIIINKELIKYFE